MDEGSGGGHSERRERLFAHGLLERILHVVGHGLDVPIDFPPLVGDRASNILKVTLEFPSLTASL